MLPFDLWNWSLLLVINQTKNRYSFTFPDFQIFNNVFNNPPFGLTAVLRFASGQQDANEEGSGLPGPECAKCRHLSWRDNTQIKRVIGWEVADYDQAITLNPNCAIAHSSVNLKFKQDQSLGRARMLG
jgi:hypothetical protein